MSDLQKLGKDFKKEYVDNQHLLASKYDSNGLYLNADTSTTSMISAYAFILGVYPDNVSYLDISDSSSGSNLLTAQQQVRTKLGLSGTPSRTQNTKVAVTSDDGYLYWRQPTKHCPIIYSRDQLSASAKPTTRSASSSSRLRSATNKIQLDDRRTVQKLLEDFPGFNEKTLLDQYENTDHFSYKAGGSQTDAPVVEGIKHSHFFIEQASFVDLLKTLGYNQASSAKTADNIRFEVFENGGKYYAKTYIGGQVVNFKGTQNGAFELSTFLQQVYARLYFSGIEDVCIGQEDPNHNIYPQCQRGSVVAYTREFETVTHSEVVERPHMVEKVVPTERCSISAEHRVAVPIVEEVRMIERVPVPQYIHDTQIVEKMVPYEVKVPVIEEKIVYRDVETLVAEAPTHIHHIEIEKKDEPVGLPPVQFHEEIDGGWPWWLWLLPLLCCIPLIAWLLCRRPKPKPVARPKQPMAPVAAKQLTKPKEREIMAVKVEERHSPERKYVIERKVVDEAEDIEMEITKELQKSRVVREARASRAVSQGRQTAAEIAGESVMDRGARGGRKRRIKTIKKFGQVIGREEQIIDEDGNIISSKKIGLDEQDYQSDQNLRSFAGSSEHFQENYVREGYVAPTSSEFIQEKRTRRGYSSGRHLDGAYDSIEGGSGTGDFGVGGVRYVSGQNELGTGRSGRSGEFGSGEIRYNRGQNELGSGRVVTSTYRQESKGYADEGGYGRYSEGRQSRGSRSGSARHRQVYEIQNREIGTRGSRFFVDE